MPELQEWNQNPNHNLIWVSTHPINNHAQAMNEDFVNMADRELSLGKQSISWWLNGRKVQLQCISNWVNIFLALTHWGRETHICVGKLTFIASDNGLAPGRRQAIIWTTAGILLIGPLETNFNEILIKIQTFNPLIWCVEYIFSYVYTTVNHKLIWVSIRITISMSWVFSTKYRCWHPSWLRSLLFWEVIKDLQGQI